MVFQINDTKQSEGVFYFVNFFLGTWTLTLLKALEPSLFRSKRGEWNVQNFVTWKIVSYVATDLHLALIWKGLIISKPY